MKFVAYSKRVLCFLLVCAMLVLACACNNGNKDDQTSDETDDTKESVTETENPLKEKDILISGEKSFRIVYSEGNRSYALKVQDRVMGLDKNYTVGSNKYEMVLDTDKPADGTPEILIGATNRPATEEAKKLITEEGDFYSIYVSDNAIAVYSAKEAGVEAGVKDLNTKFKRRDDLAVYDSTAGSFAKAYEDPALNAATLLEALTKTAKNRGLPVISIAVSTADKLESTTVIAGNPCQNCYSVTKAYCVTAIGMLYDEGKIKVTDTIGEIFKEEIESYGIPADKWADITLHDVMRHRAGFKVGGLLDIDAQDATKWGSQDYLQLTLEAELDGKKSYKYTDAAYYLISRVVTKISGQTLDVFLAERLFNKTNCREYAFAECPQGYPMGATGLYIRSSDVAKLGRIYLDGGKYGEEKIISKEWVDLVIENGYEFGKSGAGYAKGGMRGQYLYINFEKNVSVAWHSYDPDGKTGPMGDTLHEYLK